MPLISDNNKLSTPRGKVAGVVLLRDKQTGHPLFADYHNIDPRFYDMLSESDWLHINHQRALNPQEE